MSAISIPSISLSVELLEPARVWNVGNQSATNIRPLLSDPGLTFSGHLTRQGTLTPPSKVVFFVPLNGLLIDSRTGPLSLVKITIVLFLNPFLSTALTILPTAESRDFSIASLIARGSSLSPS